MIQIDINSDVGEGVGNEAELMPLISSCNIACGGHAGNENTMSKTIQLALRYHVKIGAHPSYPDRPNFGRKMMDISSQDLILSLKSQLTNFLNILKKEGGELHHIKPHGALYNAIAKDEDLANTFLDAVEDIKEIPIYVPYLSKVQRVAIKRGFRFYLEAFADRNYHTDLRLVARANKNALIDEPKFVLEHILNMVKYRQVKTIEMEFIRIMAHTFCIHGDTPDALEILTYLHQELPNHNIQIKR
ncbi:MAG: 5-oxoprolinase subunit PxpA [Bacteroidota bacterium]